MKRDYSALELKDNQKEGRFEMNVDGQPAFIQYRLHNNTISLLHTEVPIALEGQGVGAAVVQKAFEYIQQNDLKMFPQCSFVSTYLKRHPEWNKLLDKK